MVFEMGGPKALDLDGFPSSFFQSFWDIVSKEVVAIVQNFQRSKFIPWDVNSTFIALIQKLNEAISSNFRPISLYNFLYKIMAKVMANRLRLVIPLIINLNQGGFVMGCQILNGVILAYELTHSTHKARRNGMLLKLDISKAYDCVD